MAALLLALLLVAYTVLAVSWAVHVKEKTERYTLIDWLAIFFLWWFFWAVSTPVPFYRLLVVLLGWASVFLLIGAL